MKFFIDTANVEEIRKALAGGQVDTIAAEGAIGGIVKPPREKPLVICHLQKGYGGINASPFGFSEQKDLFLCDLDGVSFLAGGSVILIGKGAKNSDRGDPVRSSVFVDQIPKKRLGVTRRAREGTRAGQRDLGSLVPMKRIEKHISDPFPFFSS